MLKFRCDNYKILGRLLLITYNGNFTNEDPTNGVLTNGVLTNGVLNKSDNKYVTIINDDLKIVCERILYTQLKLFQSHVNFGTQVIVYYHGGYASTGYTYNIMEQFNPKWQITNHINNIDNKEYLCIIPDCLTAMYNCLCSNKKIECMQRFKLIYFIFIDDLVPIVNKLILETIRIDIHNYKLIY